MKAEPLFQFFFFGTCVRYLQDVVEGMQIHDVGNSYLILTNLRKFFEYLEQLNLPVTRRASSSLWKLYLELAKADKDATLTSEQAKTLGNLLTSIRQTLEAEIEGFYVYMISPKRIDVGKLNSDVASLFAPDVFVKLPDIAKYDLTEAGKCIVYERPTAAAFHLMRATEAVLRAFYCRHVRRNRVSLMWGPMVQSLGIQSKFRASSAYKTLFNNLDNIRFSFRNPTQHPDKIYDIQEVQDLWGLCVDVINRMSKDLPIPVTEVSQPNVSTTEAAPSNLDSSQQP